MEEQKHKINIAFDCVEWMVKKWIADKFLFKPFTELFKEKDTKVVQQLQAVVGNKKYKIYVDIVDSGYFTEFPNDPKVKEIVQYLWSSVRTVFNSVVKSYDDVKEVKLLREIDFVEEHGTFKPIIVPEDYRMFIAEESVCNEMLNKFMTLNQQLLTDKTGKTTEELQKYSEKMKQQRMLVDKIEKVVNSPEFNKYVTDNTDLLSTMSRIGIICQQV